MNWLEVITCSILTTSLTFLVYKIDDWVNFRYDGKIRDKVLSYIKGGNCNNKVTRFDILEDSDESKETKKVKISDTKERSNNRVSTAKRNVKRYVRKIIEPEGLLDS